MTYIKPGDDTSHRALILTGLILKKLGGMILSKSFGYALRSILYLAAKREETRRISVEEMAANLGIPKHFLAKVMKLIVKAGILGSVRGQHGGFYINDQTLEYPLSKLILLIEGESYFNTCLLNLGKCNTLNPCPLHYRFAKYKDEFYRIYENTSIGDLLNVENNELLNSITTHPVSFHEG